MLVVGFAISLSSAVITGSFLTGDSINGSLRDNAIASLGSVDYAIVPNNYFRQQLLSDIKAKFDKTAQLSPRLIPMIITTAITRGQEKAVTIHDVTVLGIDKKFLASYPVQSLPVITGRQVIINNSLASDLAVRAGDALLINLERPSALALDSLFARRKLAERIQTVRVTIKQVIPDNGMGAFSLSSNTVQPRLIFISRAWLAQLTGQTGKINALLLDSQQAKISTIASNLHSALSLADYGLQVTSSKKANKLTLRSDDLLLSHEVMHAAEKVARQQRLSITPSSVYLASRITNIRQPQKAVSYAMLAGISKNALPPSAGNALYSTKSGLLLNSWVAADLAAQPGDLFEIQYLISEVDGSYRTATIRLPLKGIVPITGVFADSSLVPEFSGMTDARRIGDWNPPFPIDFSLITRHDEYYWDLYRATPKAFVTMATIAKIWHDAAPNSSEAITAIMISSGDETNTRDFSQRFSRALLAELPAEAGGFNLLPVRRNAISASKATTDFSQLFLAMSFLLIFSALALAAMISGILIAIRAKDIALLQAVGLSEKMIYRIFFGEGIFIAIFFTLIGLPLGILFTQLIINKLTAEWLGVAGTATLWLHTTADSLIMGFIAGILVGLAALTWSYRKIRHMALITTLRGRQAIAIASLSKINVRQKMWPLFLLAIALVLMTSSYIWEIPSREIAFFSGGVYLLLAFMLLLNLQMRQLFLHRGETSLFHLALRNISVNRSRSMLTIGLFAIAAFMLISVAANTRDYRQTDWSDRKSGSGGYAYKATLSLPLSYDISRAHGRKLLGFTAKEEGLFRQIKINSCYLNSGDDISCNNIKRTATPRVIGVGKEMQQRNAFSITTLSEVKNPWTLLEKRLEDGAIPAFADAETVKWSLHSKLSGDYQLAGENGQPGKRIRFVGVLASSILASEIIISQEEFLRLYPSQRGARLLLIDAPADVSEELALSLRRNLSDYGLSLRSSSEVMNRYISVQNSYLATFLTLGGLGVLLGSIGLIALMMRNALERRKEFAIMSAIGFSNLQLQSMIMLEYFSLLLTGIITGSCCALLAVMPQLFADNASMSGLTIIKLFCLILITGIFVTALGSWQAVRRNGIGILQEE